MRSPSSPNRVLKKELEESGTDRNAGRGGQDTFQTQETLLRKGKEGGDFLVWLFGKSQPFGSDGTIGDIE